MDARQEFMKVAKIVQELRIARSRAGRVSVCELNREEREDRR
jgi:hypothetical protein